MKKIFYSFLALALLCLCPACNSWLEEEVLDRSAIISEKVKEVHIDWKDGSVLLMPTSDDFMWFREECSEKLTEDKMMELTTVNGVLTMNYTKGGPQAVNYSKVLTIGVPAGVIFDKVEIKTTTASVSTWLDSRETKIETTVGNIEYADTEISTGDFYTSLQTYSGSVSVFMHEDTEFTLDFNSKSGVVNCGFECKLVDGRHVCGSGSSSLLITTESGTASIQPVGENKES